MGTLVRSPLLQYIFSSGVQVSHTGDTVETTLATMTLPGGLMDKNGFVRITTLWSFTGSTNSKNMRVYFGATAFTSVAQATAANISAQYETIIRNRNSFSSQVGAAANFIGFGTPTVAVVTSAIDTTSDVVLAIKCQLALGTETISLEGYSVEVGAPS